MSKAFSLDPGYKGGPVVQGYLKKTKGIMSISRLLFSEFSKRFFTLNLEKRVFFYSKGINSGIKDIRMIHLHLIRKMVINKSQMLN